MSTHTLLAAPFAIVMQAMEPAMIEECLQWLEARGGQDVFSGIACDADASTNSIIRKNHPWLSV
jgi:hypothetical protein